jgi:adenylate kinase family enzyme
LHVYREQTEPLLAFYRDRGVFVEIDAGNDVERVGRALDAALSAQVKR